MPKPTYLPISKRIGRLKWLAITLLGVFALASAGLPSLTIAYAAVASASPSPSASASPAPSASFGSFPSPSPAASPAASASPDPSASASPDPGASALPAPSASASPAAFPSATSHASVVLAPALTARVAPPPGAIAAVALTGQPYQLPAFVRPGSWQASTVSFYGPGFYCISNLVKTCLPQIGPFSWPKLTACGVLYTRSVVGVAHRSLPCGTLVAFSHHGRTVVAPVIDRGPYVAGRIWDLSGGLCTALRHCYTGPIRWTIVHRVTGRSAPVMVALRRL